jgi:hypothetical protein
MASINIKGARRPAYVSPYLLRPLRSLAEAAAQAGGGPEPLEAPDEDPVLRLVVARQASGAAIRKKP